MRGPAAVTSAMPRSIDTMVPSFRKPPISWPIASARRRAAARKSIDAAIGLGAVRLGKEKEDARADEVGTVVAEKAGRDLVQPLDDALFVKKDETVGGCLHYRGKRDHEVGNGRRRGKTRGDGGRGGAPIAPIALRRGPGPVQRHATARIEGRQAQLPGDRSHDSDRKYPLEVLKIYRTYMSHKFIVITDSETAISRSRLAVYRGKIAILTPRLNRLPVAFRRGQG